MRGGREERGERREEIEREGGEGGIMTSRTQ